MRGFEGWIGSRLACFVVVLEEDRACCCCFFVVHVVVLFFGGLLSPGCERVTADIEVTDDKDQTPLMLAAYNGHELTVLRLLGGCL